MVTDTAADTGTLVIDGLAAGHTYRTRGRYTQAQIDEILDIAEKSGKAALRCVRPDLEDLVVVSKVGVDDDAADESGSRLPGAILSDVAQGLTDRTIRILGLSGIAVSCVTAIAITLIIRLT